MLGNSFIHAPADYKTCCLTPLVKHWECTLCQWPVPRNDIKCDKVISHFVTQHLAARVIQVNLQYPFHRGKRAFYFAQSPLLDSNFTKLCDHRHYLSLAEDVHKGFTSLTSQFGVSYVSIFKPRGQAKNPCLTKGLRITSPVV